MPVCCDLLPPSCLVHRAPASLCGRHAAHGAASPTHAMRQCTQALRESAAVLRVRVSLISATPSALRSRACRPCRMHGNTCLHACWQHAAHHCAHDAGATGGARAAMRHHQDLRRADQRGALRIRPQGRPDPAPRACLRQDQQCHLEREIRPCPAFVPNLCITRTCM